MTNPYKIMLLLAACGFIASNSVTAAAADIEMISVKGGCFQMGDTFGDGLLHEQPAHEVCLSDFKIGKFEITQAQWLAVMGTNPSAWVGDDKPVDNVSWNDIQAYILKLNSQSGKNYRLPTEAEWEYAARSGGKKEKWSGTNTQDKLVDYANYEPNSASMPAAVGTKKPNGLGIYDMSGNLREWVLDYYSDSWYKSSDKKNPQGPKTGTEKVQRGGSWSQSAVANRATNRDSSPPNDRDDRNGFRLVLQ